jgi:hypothetical protein
MEDKKEPNLDIEKFMYQNIYDELNRCRDWPLKIIGFTSGFYISVLGFLTIYRNGNQLSCAIKAGIAALILILGFYCVVILRKQHLEYLKYRNTQIRLQKRMKIAEWLVEGRRVIPEEWDNELIVKPSTNRLGWLFYVCFITCLSLFSICILIIL